MTSSQDLHDRIVGQNLPKRFLTNLDRHGDTEVVNWKTSAGEWTSKTLRDVADDAARLDGIGGDARVLKLKLDDVGDVLHGLRHRAPIPVVFVQTDVAGRCV